MKKPVNLNPLLLIALVAAIAFAVEARRPAHGQGGERAASKERAARTNERESATSRKPAAVPDAGWIGVMLEQGKGETPRVAAVFPAGPAAYAGIREGDRVIQAAGRDVKSAKDVALAIEKTKPGQQIELVVKRGSEELKLTAQVESLGAFHRRYRQEMMRRDPRHPEFGTHPGVSPADMSLEFTRRLFEQHERLERSLHQVLVELHALRKQVDALKTK